MIERAEAIKELKKLEGKDLRPLADKFNVTVWKGDKLNKGWTGHVIERYLGLQLTSTQSPDFGSWELKIVPLTHSHSGEIVVKETMAITMINPDNVLQKDFEDSHLLAKLKKIVVCARMFESKKENTAIFVNACVFDLNDPIIYNQIKSDYDIVRETLKNKGFEALTGAMGVLVQPRTKGPGHGSISRAFYARTKLVSHIIGLSKWKSD